MLPNRKRVYLASRSPRRRELLKQMGVDYELLLLRESTQRESDVDETPFPGEEAGQYALRIARAKAEAGMKNIMQRRLPRLYPPYPLLAADTAVALDGVILGKPESGAHAMDMLRLLSGREHQVCTAVAVAFENRLECELSVTRVSLRELSEAEISAYVASGEPLDKAGAYAIQGLGGVFVASIQGSYSGVMGLPLYETAQLLRRYGHTIV